MSGADQPLGRALAFLRRSLELTADSARPVDGDLVVRTPSLPDVWALNQLRVPRPVTPAEVEALVAAHLGAQPYGHVVIEDDGVGRELEPGLRERGWKAERALLMGLDGTPAHRERAPAVVDPGEREMVELMRRWFGEGVGRRRAEIDQLVEFARREGRTWGERRYGVIGPDGRLASIAKLRSDGRTAQIEDVYTAPEARGRGYAGTLVAHASATARADGHELIFIVADDDDWPKQLYARLGFAGIGRIWEFHRGRP